MAALCQWALDEVVQTQMAAVAQVAEEAALVAAAVALAEAEPAVVGKFACFKRNFHSPLRIDY